MADAVAGLGIDSQSLARQGLDKELHGSGVVMLLK
jgi:hypothetical protein